MSKRRGAVKGTGAIMMDRSQAMSVLSDLTRAMSVDETTVVMLMVTDDPDLPGKIKAGFKGSGSAIEESVPEPDWVYVGYLFTVALGGLDFDTVLRELEGWVGE